MDWSRERIQYHALVQKSELCVSDSLKTAGALSNLAQMKRRR